MVAHSRGEVGYSNRQRSGGAGSCRSTSEYDPPHLGEELGLCLLQQGEGDSRRVLLVRDAAVDAVAVVRDKVDREHAALHGVALARLHEGVRVGHKLTCHVWSEEDKG